VSGRHHGGLVEVRGDPQARLGILTLGSVIGTLEDALEEAREAAAPLPGARLLKLRSFRPFPAAALRAACAGLETLVVLERALSPGSGGIVGPEVQVALASLPHPPRILNFAAGLGGRDLGMDLYQRLLERVQQAAVPGREAEPFAILDVDPSLLPAEDR
jgi:pyruvate ferredoxin oxidoreductase alpha subunit